MATFTVAEVGKHTNEASCWIILYDKVYDVTNWINEHPGGRKILLAQGGKDATSKFQLYHTKQIYENIASKYCIGQVGQTNSAVPSPPHPRENIVIPIANKVHQEEPKYNTKELNLTVPDELMNFAGIPFADPAWYFDVATPYYKPSHIKVRNFMRKFTETEIIPYCKEWDESKKIPKEVFKRMARCGITQSVANGIDGGKGVMTYDMPAGVPLEEWNEFHDYIIMDELSRCGSGGVTWALAGGMGIGLPPIMKFGTPEQKEKWARPAMAGDKFACLCVTEPSGGSDVANLTTTAVESEDGKAWIVNGEKKWITNGVWADIFTVAVRTGGPGGGGVSLLVMERGMPGLKTAPLLCSGVWASGTSYITFDDVRVPKENLLGQLNKGFKCIMENFNHERMGIVIQATRFSRCVFEDALVYAHKRKTFGKFLIEHPVIRNKFAHMARKIEACHSWMEALLYQTTTMDKASQPLQLGGPIALLKAQSTQCMEFCCREAAQIFGGLAYTRSGQGERVERLYREVRAFAIPGGSEEIMLDLGIRQSVKVAQFMGAKL